MSDPRTGIPARLAHGVVASLVAGMAAGAVAWLLAGLAPALTTDYTRLDQLNAMITGAAIGGTVLGTRAYRHRAEVLLSIVSGTLLGGVGALAGATPLAFAHLASTPRQFLLERALAWGLMSTGAAALLSVVARPTSRDRFVERLLLALFGGSIGGVVFTLPGVSDLWQGISFLWVGAAIGIAIAGPEAWHAAAIIETLPERGRQRHLFAVREWLIDEGDVVALGEAQVSCQHGRIALYPPAGGVVAAGHAVRHPTYLHASQIIAVGRARYRLQLIGPR